MFEATSKPFAVDVQRRERNRYRVALGRAIGPVECVQALDSGYRVPQWSRITLLTRATCLAAVGDPRASAARDDLSRFLETESPVAQLVPERNAPAKGGAGAGPVDLGEADAGGGHDREDEAPAPPVSPESSTDAAVAR